MKIEAKDMYKTKKIILEEKYSRGSGSNGKLEIIGIVAPYISSNQYRKEEYMILDLSGEKYLTHHYNIIKIGIVRNVPHGIRKQLNAIGQEIKSKNKIMEEFLLIKNQITEDLNKKDDRIDQHISSLKTLFSKEFGLYTKDEFSQLIDSSFKDIILKRLNKENYTFGKPYAYSSIYNNLLRFEAELYSYKYAKEGALGVVYQEYDGTLHVDCRKDEEIKIVNNFLRKNNLQNLDNLNAQAKKLMQQYKGLKIRVDHDIYVGDKNTLVVELLLFMEHSKNYKYNDDFVKVIKNALNKLLK